MNGLAWIAQIILAACFLVTGSGKLFAYKRLLGVVDARLKGPPTGVSAGLASFIGVAEIAGALAVVMPLADLASGTCSRPSAGADRSRWTGSDHGARRHLSSAPEGRSSSRGELVSARPLRASGALAAVSSPGVPAGVLSRRQWRKLQTIRLPHQGALWLARSRFCACCRIQSSLSRLGKS